MNPLALLPRLPSDRNGDRHADGWLNRRRLAAQAFGLPLLLAGLLAAGAAVAQYKVVGPDGKVTYTDQPPAPSTGSRVSDVRLPGASPSRIEPWVARLPYELRQAVQQRPVVLYTSDDCSPCERARRLLRERGIPFQERSARAGIDGEAMERATGSRTVPTLAVGTKMIRGLVDPDWLQALDQAGYPARSALPANWQPPPVQPLVAAAAPTPDAARTAPRPVPPPAAAATPAAQAPGTIRF